jgi:hypothetical protein
MLDACLELSGPGTDIAIGCDDDDVDRYREIAARFADRGHVRWFRASRIRWARWTNELASLYTRFDGEPVRYRAFASLGDDHIPRTQDWDRLLLEAIDRMGGTGIAYGDDLNVRERLPTAAVISADIVEALGWICEPSLRHMYADNVWRDIGRGAECLAYLPEVVIEHVHWRAGKAPPDRVYIEAEECTNADKAAYERWRAQRMADDVKKVQALREAIRP